MFRKFVCHELHSWVSSALWTLNQAICKKGSVEKYNLINIWEPVCNRGLQPGKVMAFCANV